MTIATTPYHRSLHLAEEELLARRDDCPWCGGVERRPVAPLQSSPEVLLLECRGCRACSASRMPTSATLERYYASYYESPAFAEAGDRVTIGDPRAMALRLARWMRSFVGDREVRVLDFGGGDGTVSALAAAELVRSGDAARAMVTVVDYEPQTVDAPPGVEIERFATLAEVAGRQYDVVLASAVLEHIPEARAVLADLLELVRPKGAFYARTPQMAAFVGWAWRLGWRLDFTFPGHVHDLGQRFWEGLFRGGELGGRFRIVESIPSLVEARFAEAPLRATMAYACKLPWRLLGERWPFVGGWEIVVERRGAKAAG